MFIKIVFFINIVFLFILSLSSWASDDALDMVQRNALISSVSQVVTPTLLEDRLPKQARPITFGVLDALPRDVIGGRILKYCCDHKILQVNTSFFTLATGYPSDHILDQGFDSRPAQYFYPTSAYVKLRSFRKNLDQIPSFVWYSLIQDVSNVDPQYWPYLKQSQIKKIYFGGSVFVTPEQIIKLGQCLEETNIYKIWLVQFDKRRNSFDSSELKTLFQSLIKPNVKKFVVSSSCLQNIQKENIEILSKTNIHTLVLNFSNIGNHQLIVLSQILPSTNIHTLNLSCNNIKSDGVATLTQILPKTKIHTLHLGDNNIESVGAIALSKALPETKIHTLRLNDNDIGNVGTVTLAQVLPKTKIHTLDLEDNNIESVGTIALAQALPKTKIHTLNLKNNNIESVGINTLIEILSETHLHTLQIGDDRIDAKDIFKLCQNVLNTNIHTICLSNVKKEGAQCLIQALQKTSLLIICLDFSNIGDEHMKILAENLCKTNVHTLILGGNKITNMGMRDLIQNLIGSCVTELNLENNRVEEMTEQDVAIFEKTSLKKVYLGFNKIYRSREILKSKYPQINFNF